MADKKQQQKPLKTAAFHEGRRSTDDKQPGPPTKKKGSLVVNSKSGTPPDNGRKKRQWVELKESAYDDLFEAWEERDFSPTDYMIDVPVDSLESCVGYSSLFRQHRIGNLSTLNSIKSCSFFHLFGVHDHMKKLLLISVFLGHNVFAQERPVPSPTSQPRSSTATMAAPLPLPPSVDVDIKEQADSPIHLSIDEAVKGRLPGTPLKVRNDSGSVVAAYVLRVDIEPYGLNQMVILGPKGLVVGDARVQALPMSNYRAGAAKPVVSVDYVQFTDGKTWGADSLARSKHVAAYLKGRSEALARVHEMLVGQDATEINRAFDVFGSSSFAEPNMPTGRPPRYLDYAGRGYEEVINILRRMPRNTEVGRDLANRLEVTMKSRDQ